MYLPEMSIKIYCWIICLIAKGAKAWRFIFKPEDYVYSSARDYSGEVGLLEGVVVIK
jgi:hypothetical protein